MAIDTPTRDELFAAWLDEHQGIVIKVARSFASGTEVDDLIQEILLRLWKSAESYRGDAKVSTWIYRVALNRALTWKRDTEKIKTRQEPIAHIADVAAPDTSESIRQLDQVYEQLRLFPEVDRSLLLLSLDGFSYEEMSEITGMTTSNVGVRLSRARTRLLTALEAEA